MVSFSDERITRENLTHGARERMDSVGSNGRELSGEPAAEWMLGRG